MSKIVTTDDLSAAGLEPFDAIIDVRSPSEYAEDHLPGAINLPVLDDEERARVGTHYKQVSVFEARRMGAALVSRNIARHLETALADRPRGFKPLVYCWRGGQRSHSMATIMAEVGWRVTLLEGGYRTWRRHVVDQLDRADPIPVTLIDGQTGTAKTSLLLALQARGEQIIDLEGLACHRGSIFGDFADQPQPSQKAFETAVLQALRALDPARPVYVEAESRQVGRCRVPPRLWRAMQAAPRIVIEAPLDARAGYLVSAYPDLIQDREKLDAAIEGLRGFHSREVIASWQALAEAGDHQALARALVEHHYDPAYNRARKRQSAPAEHTKIQVENLLPEDIDRLAEQISQTTRTPA
ncbi:tRNA 2-selenouridine(34) synthase MnmH [Maricaulis sp. CAU 1757]